MAGADKFQVLLDFLGRNAPDPAQGGGFQKKRRPGGSTESFPGDIELPADPLPLGYDQLAGDNPDGLPAGNRGRSLPGDIELPKQIHTDIALEPDPRLDTNRYPEAGTMPAGSTGRQPAPEVAAPVAPEHDHAATIRKFLNVPGDTGNLGAIGAHQPPAVGHANDALDASTMHHSRHKEMLANLANDPKNERLQMIAKQLGIEDAQDPYSFESREAAKAATISSDEAARRTLTPDARHAKEQSMKDVGTVAHNTSFGTEMGKVEGEASHPGQFVADAASRRKINEVTAPVNAMFGAAGGTANPMIDTLAKQFAADPSYPIPTHLKDAVVLRAATLTGGLNGRMTNQQRQMSEGANDILESLPHALQLARELDAKGLFKPVLGSVRTWAAGHGAGTLMGVDDETATKIGRFNSLIEAVKSGFARAHAGARGAGNSQMAERFDKLAPVQGDFPTFLGGLQGMGDMLKMYALHTNSNAQNTADAGDPYSDPNWGKQ